MSPDRLSPHYQYCQRLFQRWYPDLRDAGQQYQELIGWYVGPRSNVLDIGCGRTSIASQQLKKARIPVGIDLSLDDLRENNTTYGVLGDAACMPFADNSFDVVTSQWTMEHLEEPQRVFDEIGRVLKQGGHLVLLTTNARNYVPLLDRLTPSRLRRKLLTAVLARPEHEIHPTFHRANTLSVLSRLAQSAGLRVVEHRYVGNPFYLAFSPALFRLALIYEKITDHPQLRKLKLYLVAVVAKD